MKRMQERYRLNDQTEEGQDKRINIPEQLLTGWMLSAGFLAVQFCFIPAGIAVGAILILAAACSVLLLAGSYKQNLKPIVRMILVLIMAASVFCNMNSFRNGFLYWLNQWIGVYNTDFHEFIPEFVVGAVSLSGRIQVMAFVTVIAMLLVWDMLENHRVLVGFTYIAAIFFCCCVLHLAVNVWCMVLTILGWMYLWIRSASSARIAISRNLALLLPIAVLVGLAGLTGNYRQNRQIAQMKTNLSNGWDLLRYGEDSLPRGNLAIADKMTGSRDRDALQISLQNPEELYLKGFVGGDFSGHAWSPLDKAGYDQEERGMMSWLEEQGFAAITQFAEYQSLVSENQDEQQAIIVKNRNAYRKYLYLPYEVKNLTRGRGVFLYDGPMKAEGFFGAVNYAFNTVETQASREILQKQKLDQSREDTERFLQAEQVYHTFVYNQYLNLPETEGAEAKHLFFADRDWTKASVGEITSQIRMILQGLAAYTEYPVAYQEHDAGFLAWFLEQEKQGNAAYFATAAAMAYRSAGVPARYAEGYYLPAAEAERLRTAGSQEVVLTAADAHAWVEIYMDEVGWIPIEVVPGFYFAEYTTRNVLDAPDSSIRIENNEEGNQLSGTTADSLPIHANGDSKNHDEPVIQKVWRITGSLIALLLLLLILRWGVLCQRIVRRMIQSCKVQKASSEMLVKALYQQVCKSMKEGEILQSYDFPFQNEQGIEQLCGKAAAVEYHHFIELVQRTIFGGCELTEAERLTVIRFEQHFAEAVYQKAGFLKKKKMKYLSALI